MAKIDHISYGGTSYEIVPAAGDLRDIVAPEFSDQSTYTAGQMVLKNGVLYKFTSDHSGAWTGTDAVEVTVGKELTDLKADLSLTQEGYDTFEFDVIQNSYPDNTGTFQPYTGWDRTDYIPVTQPTVYFNNPTRTTSDNAMYDANKTFLGRFTVAIGNNVAVNLVSGTAYIVCSNRRTYFFKSIYEKSSLISEINSHIADIETDVKFDTSLNKTIYDWSFYGSDYYPLGWREGRYNLTTGEGNTQKFYLRTLAASNIIATVEGAQWFNITVPSGYAVQVAEYDINGDFVKTYGNCDIRNASKTESLNVKTTYGYNYKFSVGRFANSDSDTHIRDLTLINSFVLTIYWKDDINDINDYYNGYLQDKVNVINALSRECSAKTLSMIFITDYHLLRNARQSKKLIKYITERTGINKVVFGGDAFQNWKSLNESMANVANVYSTLEASSNATFLCVTGNHEWNDVEGERNTQAGINQITTARCAKVVNGLDQYGNYYIDDAVCKTRIFFLSCNVSASVPWESITYLGNQLNNIPNGYFVMVVCHCGILNDNGTLYQKNTYLNVSKLLGAYDKHTSVTLYDSDNVEKGTYDYGSSTGSAVCYLCGHVHEDLSITKADDVNGVLLIATTGDLYMDAAGNHYTFIDGEGNTVTRNVGTIYEQAFDVIHIDTINRKVYCTRIGAGVDREFNF